jgi:hypothetical protein
MAYKKLPPVPETRQRVCDLCGLLLDFGSAGAYAFDST